MVSGARVGNALTVFGSGCVRAADTQFAFPKDPAFKRTDGVKTEDQYARGT